MAGSIKVTILALRTFWMTTKLLFLCMHFFIPGRVLLREDKYWYHCPALRSKDGTQTTEHRNTERESTSLRRWPTHTVWPINLVGPHPSKISIGRCLTSATEVSWWITRFYLYKQLLYKLQYWSFLKNEATQYWLHGVAKQLFFELALILCENEQRLPKTFKLVEN